MIEPRPRLGLLLTIVAVLGVLLAATSACNLVTGRNDRPTGNSPEVNQELAADVRGEIVDALPGAEVLGANYRDDINLPATLSLSVRVPDLPTALTQVSTTPIPDLPDFTDPDRPLAPIAARIVQIAWSTEIDPILSLVVEVRLAGEAQVIDTFYVGVTDSEDTPALEEAFGPRP